MNTCQWCGRVVADSDLQCLRCEKCVQDPDTDLDAVIGDGSATADWFVAGTQAGTDSEFISLHQFAAVEGLFNVEGGYAALMSKQFKACDECEFSSRVDSSCDECGRGPETMATCLAGWGDGAYPVLSVSGGLSEEATAALAIFASAWITDEPVYEAWRASFAFQLRQAVPILLGTLPVEDEVRFSDASGGTTITIPMSPGDASVVAWVAEVPIFSGSKGGLAVSTSLRPIAMGVYVGELRGRVQKMITPLDDVTQREVVSGLWGWPTQIHSSHRVPRSPLEMETLTCRELDERVHGNEDDPRYETLIGRTLVRDHFHLLENQADHVGSLHNDGHDRMRALALWFYGYLDEARSVLQELMGKGDSQAYVDLVTLGSVIRDYSALLSVIPTTLRLSADQRTAVNKVQLAEGWIKYRGGDLEGAVATFNAAVETQPGEAAYCLGLVADVAGDTRAAVNWWIRAADAGSTDAIEALARHFFTIGEGEKGSSWATRGIAEGNTDCMTLLARWLWDQGNKVEATDLYVRAAQAGDVGAFDPAGQLLHSQSKPEAEYFLTRAAREATEPFDIANAANTLAFCYLIPQGRLDEAEEILRRAIAVDAGEPSVNAMSNLGIVFFERGDDISAAECFNQVLAGGLGDITEAKDYLARITQRTKAQFATTDMKFCIECGTARVENLPFCGDCGFRFPSVLHELATLDITAATSRQLAELASSPHGDLHEEAISEIIRRVDVEAMTLCGNSALQGGDSERAEFWFMEVATADADSSIHADGIELLCRYVLMPARRIHEAALYTTYAILIGDADRATRAKQTLAEINIAIRGDESSPLFYSERWRGVDVTAPITGTLDQESHYVRLLAYFHQQDSRGELDDVISGLSEDFMPSITGYVIGLSDATADVGVERETAVKATADWLSHRSGWRFP